MNLGFKQIIDEIEAAISPIYVSGAIRWADDHLENAWSNAINRFEKALIIAIDRSDYKLAEIEGEYYRATLLDLIAQYKRHHRFKEEDLFLSGLKEKISMGQVL